MREKDLGIWHVYSWARLPRPGAADGARARQPRPSARRGGGSDRPQPAELGLGRARGARAGLHVARHLRGRARGRGRLPDRARPASASSCARTRSRSTSCSSSTMPSVRLIVYRDDRGMRKYDDPRLVGWERLLAEGGRAAGGRARAVRGRDRARPGRGRGDPVHDLGHHRPAQARHAPAPAVPRAHRGLPARRPAGCPPTSMSRSCRCPGSWSRSTSWRCRSCAGSG